MFAPERNLNPLSLAFNSDRPRESLHNLLAHPHPRLSGQEPSEVDQSCARKRKRDKRTKARSSNNDKAKESRVEPQQRHQASNCSLCGEVLTGAPRYQCPQCRNIQYCVGCNVNAARLHPAHLLDLVQPTENNTCEEQQRCRPESLGESVEPRGTEDTGKAKTPRAASGAIRASGPKTTLCRFCWDSSISFECEDCYDASFCARCAKLHTFHTLKPIQRPVGSPEQRVEGDVDGARLDGTPVDEDGTVEDGHSEGGHNARLEDLSSQRATSIEEEEGTNEGSRRSQGSTTDFDHFGRENTQQHVPPRKQPGRRPSIHISHETLEQMTSALRTMTEVVERVLSKHDPELHAQLSKTPKSLLSVPIDFATLDEDSECEDSGDECEYEEVEIREIRRTSRENFKKVKWTPDDQRKLSLMKEKGWDNKRIGLELGRTAGAVQQQWRKQN